MWYQGKHRACPGGTAHKRTTSPNVLAFDVTDQKIDTDGIAVPAVAKHAEVHAAMSPSVPETRTHQSTKPVTSTLRSSRLLVFVNCGVFF
jgi:hypothetical protein